MKKLCILSMLMATVFVVALTLPYFTDTGPVTKTEKSITVNSLEKVDMSVTAITQEASPDIGVAPVYAVNYENVVHFDLEKQYQQFYPERYDRSYPAQYGYIAKRPCKMQSNIIRPPALLRT